MLSYLLPFFVKVFSIELLTCISLTFAVQPNVTPQFSGLDGACRSIIFKFGLFVKVPPGSDCTKVCSGYFKDFDFAIEENLKSGLSTCWERSQVCKKGQKVSNLSGDLSSSPNIAYPAEASTSEAWLQLRLGPPVPDVICKCEHALLVYRVRKSPKPQILLNCEPLALCERLTLLKFPADYDMRGKTGQPLEPRKWQCLTWDLEENVAYPRIIDDNVACTFKRDGIPDYVPWCTTCNAPFCDGAFTNPGKPQNQAGPSHVSGKSSLRDFYECPVLYPFDAAAYKTVAQRKAEAQKARDQRTTSDQETRHVQKKQKTGKAETNVAGAASSRDPDSVWSRVTATTRADVSHSLGASNIVLSRFPFFQQPSPWPSDNGASTSAAGGSGRNNRDAFTAGNQKSTDSFQFGRISQTSQELRHMDNFQRITSSADGSGPSSLARPYTGNAGNPSAHNLHLSRGPLRSAAALPSLTLGLAMNTAADELLADPASEEPPNADCEDPAAADDAVGFL